MKIYEPHFEGGLQKGFYIKSDSADYSGKTTTENLEENPSSVSALSFSSWHVVSLLFIERGRLSFRTAFLPVILINYSSK